MQRFVLVFDLTSFDFCHNHFRERLFLMSGIISKILFIFQKT